MVRYRYFVCGVAGIFHSRKEPVDFRRVEQMRDRLFQRGPDGMGLTHGPGYALGHRRLSIIDLSENGKQPMQTSDGRLEIVYNGEIYNFQELRDELEAQGARFHSKTDTEVLLWGYKTWGLERLLQKIRGMYAFGILDKASWSIHLVRDPLGKKPLFYHYENDQLCFASSIPALQKGIFKNLTINPSAIQDLLWNLYIPGPQSIFKEIQKLQPGHFLSLNEQGQIQIRKFWAPCFKADNKKKTSEWILELESCLRKSVQRRLVSDVPLGLLLSGGVDSSLITAFASQNIGKVKTFSVKTEDPRWDESIYSKKVAERYQTEHFELPVTGNFREDFSDLVAAMGEPLADASAANVFSISKLARQYVTVVLTGDGGDEAFGGYSHLWGIYHAEKIKNFLPSISKKTLLRFSNILRKAPVPIRRLGTLIRYASLPVESLFDDYTLLRQGPSAKSLFHPAFHESLKNHQHFDHYHHQFKALLSQGTLNQVMDVQLLTILADDYLPKIDLGSMAVSLEARSPFLDIDLLELAMQIPHSIRFLNKEPKGLLREIARRHLPHECIDRPKRGFVAPVGKWLRRKDWKDLLEDRILGKSLRERELFEPKALQQIMIEHQRGLDHSYLLWAILVLEEWLRGVSESHS